MWGTVSSTDRVTQSYCTNKALIQPRFRVYWLMFSERMYCIMPITQPVQMVWQEWLCLLHCMVTHHNSSSTLCLSTTSFFLLRDSIKLIAINQKSWIQFWINRIIKWSRDVVIKNCTKYQPPETVIINAGSKRSPISLLITVVLPTLLSPINTTFSVKGIVNFLIFIYILMKYFFIQSCNIVVGTYYVSFRARSLERFPENWRAHQNDSSYCLMVVIFSEILNYSESIKFHSLII